MSRGKNFNAIRRGNRTLAWYMDSKVSKVLDQADTQERDNTVSPALQRRKNSFDSESSLNSSGRQTANEADERKRRANKARVGRQCSQNSQNEDSSDSIPVGSAPSEHPLVSSDQQAAALQQHILALSAQATQEKGRENYWYYDANSDGYFYEFCGSRGWRKRNPKLHGNPTVQNKPVEESIPPGTQIIEKKVYVPVPVFTNGSKFFPQAGTSPNIKYYDPSSDGFVFETASVDGWKKRNTVHLAASMHSMGQSPRVEPSSLVSFPPLGRDLTSRELEELILAKMKCAPNHMDKNSVPFASVVSRNLKNNVGMAPQRPTEPEYPSSSSTVSSSVSSDNATPPPNAGKENQCQQLFAQTKEPTVGSFEEPYEFYWSDSEKPDSTQPTEQAASSVSSVDEFNPLSAYFNEMSMNNQQEKQNLRVQRPSSLKIVNPPNADKRLPNFNIDRFIADLPGNDNFGMSTIYAPFGTDSPRTPFNQYSFTKESPMFTPMLPKENAWNRFNTYKQEEFLKDKALAESNIERGLRDIEKIWN